MFRYVNLTSDDITPNFLMGFHHHQIIEKKYVLVGGKWEISETHEIGDWSDKKEFGSLIIIFAVRLKRAVLS